MPAWLLYSQSRKLWVDGDGYIDIPRNAERFAEATANKLAAADPDLVVEFMVSDAGPCTEFEIFAMRRAREWQLRHPPKPWWTDRPPYRVALPPHLAASRKGQ